MIVEQAVERAVNAIVDVVHDVIDVVTYSIVNVLLRVDVRDESERGCDVESSWLSDDAHVLFREVSVQPLIDNHRHIINCLVIVAWESSANVQQSHGEAKFFSLVEEFLANSDRLVVDWIITTAGAYMEADTHHIKVHVAGDFQQLWSFDDRVASELLAQRALSFLSFTANAKYQTKTKKRSHEMSSKY